MKKSLTTNNFKNGLIMDINPMQMPNTAYINGLNVTLITKDGNEHILQNDMGNGRVETAYLPEGYIPLGTCSLGGIIYVASYNPLKDKGLIGCFPSPERNISSDEDSELNVELTNNDFQFKPDETNGSTSSEGAQTYYLKKQLWADRQFNPGDKFIVYGSPISDNFEKLWIEKEYNDLLNSNVLNRPLDNPPTPIEELWGKDMWNLIKLHTVRLSIGTITNTGKLIIFSNLKEYNTNNTSPKMPDGETTYPYIIFEYNNPDNPQKTDLDDYRSLVSQPYNVFNSKISGQLVLIAELVQFNDFDMTITNKMGEDEDGHKTYEPVFSFNYEGDYPYIPYGAECEFEMTWKNSPVDLNSGDTGKEFKDYNCYDDNDDSLVKSDFCENNGLKYKGYKLEDPFSDSEENPTSIRTELDSWSSTGFFDNKERNSGGKIRYKIKPSMIWGPVSYLEVDGLIDLDKIGTGYIGITQWRYYNDDNTCTLNWGLEVYEEDGYEVKQIVMRMTRVTGYTESYELGDLDNKKITYTYETIDYYVDTYDSYFGTFTENIPLNKDYFKIKKVTETIKEIDGGKHPVKQIYTDSYDENYYQLKSNQLYFVDIRIWYQDVDNDEINEEVPTRHAYRWLYTNGIFNNYYGRSLDFGKEQINFDISFATATKNYGLDNPSFTQSYYGEYFKLIKNNDNTIGSSDSIIQNEYDIETNVDIEVKLKNDYNTFDIDVSTADGEYDPFIVTVGTSKDDVDITTTITSLYTGNDSIERQTKFSEDDENAYAETEEEFNKYKNINEYVNSDDGIFGISHTVYYVEHGEGLPIVDTKAIDNTINITIDSKLLLTIRAFCTTIDTTLNIVGMYRPLAYDSTTFAPYGLEWDAWTDDKEVPHLQTNTTNDWTENGFKLAPTTNNLISNTPSTNAMWQCRQIGLFGQIEPGSVSGRAYGAVCARDAEYDPDYNNARMLKKIKFNAPIEIKKVDAIGFHFQGWDECALTWKDLGITTPIAFFFFYFGGRYMPHRKAYDGNPIKNGTDAYVVPGLKNKAESPRFTDYFFGLGENGEARYWHIVLLTMRNVNGDYYQIPLNVALIFCDHYNTGDKYEKEDNYIDSLRKHPGYVSYYGFPHVIAQIFTNIYIYTNDEITNPGYVPQNIYWESVLDSAIKIPISVDVDNIYINTKKVYLRLDDGHSVDLHDMYKIMAEKLGVEGIYTDSNNLEYTYHYFYIENNEEKHITECKILKDTFNKLYWNKEFKTDILHPNIDYKINDVDPNPYELTITIGREDKTSGEEIKNVFMDAQLTTLKGALMDYDGETLVKIDKNAKQNTKLLYMREDGNGDIVLASKFQPRKVIYDKDSGTALYVDTYSTNPYLDTDADYFVNLNDHFTIDNGKIYLNDNYTTYTGDIKFPIVRQHDRTYSGGNANTYCDGIINVPLISALKIPNT